MIKHNYPKLVVNREYLTENVQKFSKLLHNHGIKMAGVVKGTTGLVECSKCFEKGGADILATSRIEQIEDAIEAGIKIPTLLLRITLPSEVEDVVRICDYSLQSEETTLELLNEAAKKTGKVHKVILMADLGDLREGFWDKEDMIRVALKVEKEMDNVQLAGVGTNLGCYGSVAATESKLNELVEIAEKIEELIGRKLDIISGGATTSMPRIFGGDMPAKINQLRIGESVLTAWDLQRFSNIDMSFMHQDVYKLQAEVIEVKIKPSHPVGELSHDAFGNTPVYEDRGIRKRALLGVGKVDYGNIKDLRPIDENIMVVGASGDHTILDIEDVEYDIKPGDIVEFKLNYSALIYLSNCRSVKIEYI